MVEPTEKSGKKKSKNKTGDEGEKFVHDKLIEMGYLSETHPRTFRLIYINGKRIQVSQDNDYYRLFDEKSESRKWMIYSQVKIEDSKANTSAAQKEIDKSYPYEFPYQRILTWQLWKEKEGRKTEMKFRIQERKGFTEKFWKRTDAKKGNWVDIDIKDLEIGE